MNLMDWIDVLASATVVAVALDWLQYVATKQWALTTFVTSVPVLQLILALVLLVYGLPRLKEAWDEVS